MAAGGGGGNLWRVNWIHKASTLKTCGGHWWVKYSWQKYNKQNLKCIKTILSQCVSIDPRVEGIGCNQPGKHKTSAYKM